MSTASPQDDTARLALLLEHLSSLGHDLRNPIASLLLGVQRLERGPAITPERTAALLARLERSVRGLDRLVETLLDLARVESGRLALDPGGEPPEEVAAQAVAAVAGFAAEGRRSLEVAVPPGLAAPPWDGARAAKAVAHLLAPALEFTPLGGTVRLSAAAERGGVRFTVEDGGPPLSSGEAEALFAGTSEPTDARAARRRAHGPFLYLARRLAEAHGGAVEAKPGARGGAELSVWFPGGGGE
jgi:signal transduction histidine kinase